MWGLAQVVSDDWNPQQLENHGWVSESHAVSIYAFLLCFPHSEKPVPESFWDCELPSDV